MSSVQSSGEDSNFENLVMRKDTQNKAAPPEHPQPTADMPSDRSTHRTTDLLDTFRNSEYNFIKLHNKLKIPQILPADSSYKINLKYRNKLQESPFNCVLYVYKIFLSLLVSCTFLTGIIYDSST